jgi:hypothetical protein
MLMNGDRCIQFGVYRSLCCGVEIIIAAGATFPECPKHVKLPTSWKPVNEGRIQHVFELPESKVKGSNEAA